ncbi:MAG: hypothetical protein ACYC2O_13735 [Microthrixaceae bacterium]
MARRGPREITDEHKAAMAAGRTEGRAIKNYLEALELHRPKRGRRRTVESIDARLSVLQEEIADCRDRVKLVNLVQERMDLEAELEQMRTAKETVDLEELESAFVDAAKSYSERRHISYAAWREVGVPAAVLKAAGISRAS